MNSNIKHIDTIIREKFETFAPSPPAHIWTGIEKGMRPKPYVRFFGSQRFIATSAIVLLATIASILFIDINYFATSDNKPMQNTLPEETMVPTSVNNEVVPDVEETEEVAVRKENTKTTNPSGLIVGQPTIIPVVAKTNKTIPVTEQPVQYSSNNDWPGIVKMKKSVFVCPEIYGHEHNPKNRDIVHSLPDEIKIDLKNNVPCPRWKTGFYVSPELSISDFDSVQTLNSYTLSIEPSYFINNHWFVRFGVGFSFVRNRGFARINYITNEYMGSYDDVYDITFDTVSGNVTPIYHTKTVEVWDSVRHISISEVTNRYVYLQIPALFGYFNKKPGSRIGWYFMAGPAFNLKIGSWIDDPKLEENDADIVDLQNNLPVRSNNYFQLWLGAGLEYEVNNKLSVAVEPGYRYYFKSIYRAPYNATSSSGFALRVGLVYSLK